MAKKDGPIKLPKKLAGVKIPKAVRKGAIAEFLGSTAGQKLIAEVVTAAAGAVLVKKQAEPGSATRKTAKKAKQAVGDMAEEAPAASLGAGTLAYAFSEAGRAFRDALSGSHGEAPRAAEPPDADWPADFEAPSTTTPAKRSKAEPASASEPLGKPH
jgi:hypothetical protein